MRNARMPDNFTFQNALLGDGPNPAKSVVSFKVTWEASGPAVVTDIPSKPFHGEHAPAVGQMEWSARSGDYLFKSHPIGTSSSPSGALLGWERNGSMY